jgi:CRP/FNR family cyclic AMP-dependent transcriptional regulator
LFIVLSGRLKVYASGATGKEIVIDFHGPGECVGEMSIDGSPGSASVMTTEATTLRDRQPCAVPRPSSGATGLRALL